MKFKKGERIVVYNGHRSICTITEIDAELHGSGQDQSILIDDKYWVHPKQCRKLKEPKRVYMAPETYESLRRAQKNGGASSFTVEKPDPAFHSHWIEFAEVKKK